MFAYGIIDKEQYQTLQDSLHARNVLIHGYKDDRPFARTFEQLLKVIEQLQSAQPTT
ncbi:MAG: hypothetical protein MUD01_04475 [Chloroflexaceae bacterium]|jgi:uncharacterized protein YutE (UPF0331/DUF86 family)|nr:hypothetical protein [Chloroflexaceae bacterium]